MWTRTRPERKTARVGPMPTSTWPKPWFLNNLSTKFGLPKGLTYRVPLSRLPSSSPRTFRCTVGLRATRPSGLNATQSPTRRSFRETSARRGIPTTIPITSLCLPKVRPWMDSPSKTAMRAKTSAMTTGESGRVFTPTKPPSSSPTVSSWTTVPAKEAEPFT